MKYISKTVQYCQYYNLLVPGAGCLVPGDLSLVLPWDIINLHVTFLLLPIISAALITTIIRVLQDQVKLVQRPCHHLIEHSTEPQIPSYGIILPEIESSQPVPSPWNSCHHCCPTWTEQSSRSPGWPPQPRDIQHRFQGQLPLHRWSQESSREHISPSPGLSYWLDLKTNIIQVY